MTDESIRFKTGRPPNFAAIAAVFPTAHQPGTIFTYGNVIYVSDGAPLSKSLIAHEVVHVEQQSIYGRDAWWERYLTDRAFRFQQELAAHRMEHTVALAEGSRRDRRLAEKQIAARLSGPLYGHACTLAQARRLLRETVKA